MNGDEYFGSSTHDIPRTISPVWILGQQYSALYDGDDIGSDISSRLWFTYRKGLKPIGGNGGPITDSRWGCMLRCGQMMLAQALVLLHLGRGWRWKEGRYDPKYYEILKLFIDRKDSCYSVHQIASMGVTEGRLVGDWFGPNTIAQVLRKLSIYDTWSDLAVHVALNNSVIIDDIVILCKRRLNSASELSPTRGKNSSDRDDVISSTDGDVIDALPTSAWRPLFLVIPLRLGLAEINLMYTQALRTCLSLKQSVGFVGGKPNHAHWFIGYVDEDLIYLDPHILQQMADTTVLGESDISYHCHAASRMSFEQLDPSIALGFYCGSESEFLDLCDQTRGLVSAAPRNAPIFEVYNHRPSHWPPFEPYTPDSIPPINDCSLMDDCQRADDEDYVFV